MFSLNNNLASSYNIKHLFTGIYLTLLTLFIFLAINLSYKILIVKYFTAPHSLLPLHGHSFDNSLPIKRTTHPVSRKDYQAIAQRNLFNIKRKDTPLPASVPTDDMKPTPLDLKLWGTVISNSANDFAIIETREPGKRPDQKLYAQGDNIMDARITKILADKIILESKGELNVLALEEYQSSIHRRFSYNRSARRRAPVRSRTISLKRSLIENAVNNIGSLMRQAKVTPHSKGIFVNYVKPNSIFRRLGIRNRDIITAVNGNRIVSVEDALGLYENLKSSSSVTISLLRRGRENTIHYRIY